MERAEWLLRMNVERKLLAMRCGFTIAISQAPFPQVSFPNSCTSTISATLRDVGPSELFRNPDVGNLTRKVTINALAVTDQSLERMRLLDTEPLGAHLDYFGFAGNTGIGDLTGRSTEVNSDWPTKRALNDLRFLERKI
jgi:hypothetical protein